MIPSTQETHPILCETCGGEYRAGICPSCTLRVALLPEEEPAPAEAPVTSGQFELLEVIAHGGTGVVWRARQARPRREVALKLLRDHFLPGEELSRRFRIEAEAVSRLRHPHIVTMFEVGEMGGRYFLSMELLAGSLAARLRGRTLTPEEAVALLIKIAGAVQHAHEHGVLHRDLKPSNILLDDAGEPRVSDFGLARLTTDPEHPTLTGTLLGTPAYMAPEQARGGAAEVTTRSDVYSLGAIFYEMLTGRVPFDAPSHLELLREVAEENPPRPSTIRPGLDRDLETICSKCLEKTPAARYASARALAEDLERWRRGEALHARPVSALERAWKWSRRHKSQAALLATATGGAIAFAVLSLLFTRRLQHEVRRTTAAERTALHRLATQYGESAVQLIRRDESLRALPYLAESCALLDGDPAAARINRIRFEAAVRTAPRLAHLWLPENRLRTVDFDPEAGRIAIFAGQTATLFDSGTGEAVTPPLVHDGELLHGHFLERGNRLLAQCANDTWTLWDARNGQRIASGKGSIFPAKAAPSVVDRRLTFHFLVWQKNQVQACALADGKPDGEPIDFGQPVEWAIQGRLNYEPQPQPKSALFLIATRDGFLHLWDPATRQEAAPPVPLGHDPLPRGLDWQGDRYAFEADEKRGLRFVLFDMAGRRVLEEARSNNATHRVHGWLGTPRRWCAFVREDQGFTLREVASDSRLMYAHHDAQGFTAAAARDAGILATSSRDGAIRIWHDGGMPATSRLPVGGRAEQLLLDHSGQRLLASSTEPAVRLWERREDDGASFADEAGARLAGAFFCEEALLLWRPDGRVERRDLAHRGEIVASWECGRPIRAAIAGARGRRALVATQDSATLWDASAGRAAGPGIVCAEGIRSVALSADGERFAVLTAAGVCRVANAAHDLTFTPHSEARELALSPDGRHLLVVGKKPAQLWTLPADDALSGAPALEATLSAAQGGAFSPDGTKLALWGVPQILGTTDAQVFETAGGRASAAAFVHSGEMTSATFSPDGRLLFTTNRNDARLWDVATGKLVRALRDHPLPPLAGGFSPDGTLLWTATAKELYLWEALSGTLLAPPMAVRGHGSALWSPDSRWVASFDDKQAIRAWDLSPGARSIEEMRALARLLSGHRLTEEGALYPLTPGELRQAQAAAGTR